MVDDHAFGTVKSASLLHIWASVEFLLIACYQDSSCGGLTVRKILNSPLPIMQLELCGVRISNDPDIYHFET